jgi:hypothetical protein
MKNGRETGIDARDFFRYGLGEVMLAKRQKFNPKRQIASAPIPTDLEQLAGNVRYRGNPEHKRNPGNFGLAPPASPRPHKTLCDEAGIFDRELALGLLQEGIRLGLVSESREAVYPKNVWAVSAEGVPLEAQLENPGNGTYHGYPMPEADPFRELVIAKWRAAHV